jgi:hypothetical protein
VKKGRHRRYEEARKFKQSIGGGDVESILEPSDDVDPELLAKWADIAEAHEGQTGT